MTLKTISRKNSPAMAAIALPTFSISAIIQIVIFILQLLVGGGSILSFL